MARSSWRKSSRSDGNNNNCVEVRNDLGAVRDSKAPRSGAVVLASVAGLVEWARRL